MSDLNAYPFEIAELSAEDGRGFVVTFVDIPGVIGVGEDKDEAIADGRQALFACLDALKAVDRVPPAPSASRS